jgi:NAD(P)-dependent dehydrogenase (short-subunit alcohol dehydrogenase family)
MERILITGANRGVGFALVKQYIASGDVQIFATCRTPERATELNALADQHAGEIIVVPLDINDEASIEASVKLVEQQTSALDVVINNAGIYPKGAHQSSSLGQLSLADVAEVVNTNSVSPLIVSQAYRHLLKQGNTPRLVMISSQMGSLNLAGSASMNMAAVTLSQDSQMSGVIVVTTHPGWVQTDMGGAGASITPTESASGLKALIDGLTASDNGKFYRWDGSEHAW